MKKSDFKKLTQQISPINFLDYKEYLNSLYLFLKPHISKYTYHKFASDLGLPKTNVLHHVIRGRRPLTLKSAEKISNALAHKVFERNYFLTLVEYNNAKTLEKREELFTTLISLKEERASSITDRDWLEYFTQWYHPVVGEMTRLDDFESDPEWIARRIMPNIRPEQARKSLQLLERIGLIEYNQALKRYQRTQVDPSTGHEAQGMEVVRFHQKMIEYGREAITRFPCEERDISGLTLCLDQRAFAKLKNLIHAFQRDCLKLENETQQNETVVQLNIQLFPFSKKRSR